MNSYRDTKEDVNCPCCANCTSFALFVQTAMFGLIAAALALTCLCLHAVQRGATDDENDLKYKYLWQRQ